MNPAFFRELAAALSAPTRALELPAGEFRDAAVLAPLVMRDEELRLILIRRPTSLRHHAGQIAFPGGQRDAEDGTALFTALRELHEELGVAPADVTVLGALDEIATPSGFRVAPFVGLLGAGAALVPQPAEVEEILEVPIAALLRPGVLRTERRDVFGAEREVPFYDVGPTVIWGATGFILRGLLERISRLPSWPGAGGGL